MKTKITKQFENEKWYVVFGQVERFILDYGLDLVKLEIVKKNNKFIATLEYELGVRND